MDVTATEWTPTIIDRLQIFQSAILLQFTFTYMILDLGIQHAPLFLIHDSNK